MGAGIEDGASEETATCAIRPMCPEASAALSRSLHTVSEADCVQGSEARLTASPDDVEEGPSDGRLFCIQDECMETMLQDCD